MATKPEPKDYRSYEDYLEALKLHGEFPDLSAKTAKAINEAESEEDFRKKWKRSALLAMKMNIADGNTAWKTKYAYG